MLQEYTEETTGLTYIQILLGDWAQSFVNNWNDSLVDQHRAKEHDSLRGSGAPASAS